MVVAVVTVVALVVLGTTAMSAQFQNSSPNFSALQPRHHVVLKRHTLVDLVDLVDSAERQLFSQFAQGSKM